jgi:hypothetical protein
MPGNDTHPSTDLITASELEAVGLCAKDIRQWPVPEYTDMEGQAYWLWEDLAPWLN